MNCRQVYDKDQAAYYGHIAAWKGYTGMYWCVCVGLPSWFVVLGELNATFPIFPPFHNWVGRNQGEETFPSGATFRTALMHAYYQLGGAGKLSRYEYRSR